MTQAAVSSRDLEWFKRQNKSRPQDSKDPGNQASAYADWLSQTSGKKYRLATEAEFEYACIAGGTMPAWIQTESRATADASADIAELNSWGFMDLPDTAAELTTGDSKNPTGELGDLDRRDLRFRIVRIPEGNNRAANASGGPSVRATGPQHPAAASPGKS
jgi:hypothetical protein